MASSLRDQLVKAGLATASQAKQAERQKRTESQARRHGKPGGGAAETAPDVSGQSAGKAKARRPPNPDDVKSVRARAARQHAEKVERDRALASTHNEKAATKALRAEIKQIIVQNDQRVTTASDDDVPYNFIHGKKIKKIYLPKAQQQQLSSGALVIVNNDGRYHIVTKAVAAQIAQRDPKRIIVAHDQQKAEPTPDDDYYAKFEVPDDLEW